LDNGKIVTVLILSFALDFGQPYELLV